MRAILQSKGPRYGTMIQLLRTAEVIWNSSRVLFDRWDLSPSQFNVLNLLFEQPDGMSQIELSRLLLMHRSNVTGLVDRLEERGLVKRHEQPEDRRSYQVIATAKAIEILNEILPSYYKAIEEAMSHLTEERASQMRMELQKTGENVSHVAEQLNQK